MRPSEMENLDCYKDRRLWGRGSPGTLLAIMSCLPEPCPGGSADGAVASKHLGFLCSDSSVSAGQVSVGWVRPLGVLGPSLSVTLLSSGSRQIWLQILLLQLLICWPRGHFLGCPLPQP